MREMYKAKYKMNEQLREYDKSCHMPSEILQGYNGNKPEATMAMNALFDAVNEARKSLPLSSYRHVGYGVGVEELAPAAKIGTGLAGKLGEEEGIDAAYQLMAALVCKGQKVTVGNARNLLKLIKSAEGKGLRKR